VIVEDPDLENEETEAQAEESEFQFPSFSPLQIGMLNAHELYQGARAAGFNPGQAIYLVACAVTGGPRPPTSAENLE
jgi:hypothetical protein